MTVRLIGRSAARGLLAALLFACTMPAMAMQDLAGRELTRPAEVKRVVLGEGRLLPVLAILEGDELTDRLVGMPRDLPLVSPGTHEAYRQRFPEIDQLPAVGRGSADTFNAEQVLALRPDLVVLSLHGHGPGAGETRLVEQLEAAGVAVAFVDFRNEPLRHTPRSIELLGWLLDREDAAQEFVSYYQAQLDDIRTRLDTVTERPTVFLHSRAGLSDVCCETMARGMLANLLDAAGGQNLASNLLPGAVGTISLELLMTRPADLYVASGVGSQSSFERGAKYVAMGPGVSETAARTTLRKLVEEPPLSRVPTLANGKVAAIWHDFYNTPFNIVAVQVLAKWLHPAAFADVDPAQTLQTMQQRFQPVALPGTYWVML
ncbi:ABC transporter substrate-binding protein [Halopseudomonas nanhaiensis]|uniref:ABC transporter substrate-binding protein n=1 Tax=Halopseudomonas nanhaiensis TaxID=2830842 RepID=UPI001CC00FA5|nr:ABC transporter substrate-binding protein [Halopseudomonas nanhaiensis]UAW98930.1 ABC transporter substrate-binding protein [Halopseudomonas nanhaiensis]